MKESEDVFEFSDFNAAQLALIDTLSEKLVISEDILCLGVEGKLQQLFINGTIAGRQELIIKIVDLNFEGIKQECIEHLNFHYKVISNKHPGLLLHFQDPKVIKTHEDILESITSENIKEIMTHSCIIYPERMKRISNHVIGINVAKSIINYTTLNSYRECISHTGILHSEFSEFLSEFKGWHPLGIYFKMLRLIYI